MDKTTGAVLAHDTFSKQDDGMELIKYLSMKKAIREGQEFYNIYKQDNSPITYMALSGKIGSLNLGDDVTLKFAVENEPKF